MEETQINHLITRRSGGGLDLIYYAGPDETFSYFVTRTALGAYYEDWYACVVAERTYFAREDNPASRFYIVVDEVRPSNPADFIHGLISLKDRYLPGTAYVPKDPFTETLKKTEGLTFYRRDDHENRAMWATYQDNATTVGLRDTDTNDSTVRKDLDTLMSTNATDPDTGLPILTEDRQTQPRLTVSGDPLVTHARDGIQVGMDDPAVATAVWLATNGLENSRPPNPILELPQEERRVNTAGY